MVSTCLIRYRREAAEVSVFPQPHFYHLPAAIRCPSSAGPPLSNFLDFSVDDCSRTSMSPLPIGSGPCTPVIWRLQMANLAGSQTPLTCRPVGVSSLGPDRSTPSVAYGSAMAEDCREGMQCGQFTHRQNCSMSNDWWRLLPETTIRRINNHPLPCRSLQKGR